MAYDISQYEAQRRSLLANYAQQAALNAYQRYISQQQGQRPIFQYEQQAFGTTPTGGLGEVPKLTASYGQRGLQGMGATSGVYKNALSSYAQNRARNLGYMKNDAIEQMRGFDLAGTAHKANLDEGLSNLEADKARQISADAQALLGLK
jgi:hypothetical protein